MCMIPILFHSSTNGLANRNTFGIKSLQTENIDSVAIRRTALVMKCIDAASVAEEMASGQSMELIFVYSFFASKQLKVALMYFYHHCILETTNRTITCRKLLEVTRYFKLNRLTVATT